MLSQRVLFTTELFWKLLETPEFQDKKVELIDGEIVEVSPRPLHGLTTQRIQTELAIWLRAHPIGSVFDDTDCYVPGDVGNTRRPDTCFVHRDRLAGIDLTEPFPFMPDLAVEVKSPSNYYAGVDGLIAKATYYLTNGARLVWFVDPVARTATVYAPGADPVRLTGESVLTGGEVLPGFTLSLTDIFADV